MEEGQCGDCPTPGGRLVVSGWGSMKQTVTHAHTELLCLHDLISTAFVQVVLCRSVMLVNVICILRQVFAWELLSQDRIGVLGDWCLFPADSFRPLTTGICHSRMYLHKRWVLGVRGRGRGLKFVHESCFVGGR